MAALNRVNFKSSAIQVILIVLNRLKRGERGNKGVFKMSALQDSS